MDVAAPYFSGTDLTQMAGNPALGGGAYNFNPANQNPLAGINEAIKEANAQSFQQETQRRQQKHDILTRAMEMEHQDKMMQWRQNIADRNELYKNLYGNGASLHNQKDAQGNDVSFPALPQDKEILGKSAENIRSQMMGGNYTSLRNNPDFNAQLDAHSKMTALSSVKAAQVTKLKQQLAAEPDPAEQESIQKSIDEISAAPIDKGVLPPVYQPQAAIEDPISLKDATAKENQQDFKNGTGTATRLLEPFYDSIKKSDLDNGQRIRNQFKKTAQGNSWQAYQDYQTDVNEVRAARGLPPIDLGGRPAPSTESNPNPRVIFDESTEDKRRQLNQKFLGSAVLLKYGRIVPPDSSDKLDEEKEQSEIDKNRADTYKKLHPDVKKPTAAEIKDDQEYRAAVSAKKEADQAFDYKNNPEYKPINTATQSPAFLSWIAKQGYNPEEYNFYTVPKTVDTKRGVGVQADIKTKGSVATTGQQTKSASGQSAKPDISYIAVNKNSGDVEMLNIQKKANGGGDVISAVSKRDYAANTLKHEAKYDEKQYGNKVVWVHSLYDGESQQPQQSAQPAQQASQRPATIPKTAIPVVNPNYKGYYVDTATKKIYDPSGQEVVRGK
jgi:hypothetical protein